jgi:hypothetical protein
MRVTSIVMFCALMFGGASAASGQTDNKWGLVMAFPTSAGLQWDAGARLTLRGDAAFDWGVVEQISSSTAIFSNGVPVSASTQTSDFRHSTLSVGVSGLVTVARYEQLRLYVTPRVAWRRVHSSFTLQDDTPGSISIPGINLSDSTTTNGLEVEGSFGANYRLGDRFSIFGETGIGLTSPTSSSSSSSDTMTSYIIGSRANLGVVVHF